MIKSPVHYFYNKKATIEKHVIIKGFNYARATPAIPTPMGT